MLINAVKDEKLRAGPDLGPLLRPSHGWGRVPVPSKKMVLFPCSPPKQNLDFLCSLFPKIACVPLFPLFLGLCFPFPWKNCPCSPIPQTPWRASLVHTVYSIRTTGHFQKNETEPSNYRPISLTCILCKVMEHVIASNISKHLTKHNALYELQHGFHEKRSCETQLIQLVEDLGR